MSVAISAASPADGQQRLLAAASKLFYDEGALIWAYLMARPEATRARMTHDLARYSTLRERLPGVFTVIDAASIDAASIDAASIEAP